jgi:hypothetical protein
VAGGGGRGGVPSTGAAVSPAARRWVWHERTAWLLLLYASVFGAGLMGSLHPDDALISGLLHTALVCAAIMACVCDSLLAARPMPYSWRFPMLLFAPLLPLSSAMVAWRTRRWCGLLAVGAHLLLLAGTFLAGMVAGMLVAAMRSA